VFVHISFIHFYVLDFVFFSTSKNDLETV